MKAFVQFYQTDLMDNLQPAVGSDGVFVLDARDRVAVMHQDARDRMRHLRHVKQFEAYRIFSGNLRASTALSAIVRL